MVIIGGDDSSHDDGSDGDGILSCDCCEGGGGSGADTSNL